MVAAVNDSDDVYFGVEITATEVINVTSTRTMDKTTEDVIPPNSR